jgi:hypothetical protein
VRLPDGRLETFRLYFVDTTESRTLGKRSDEQAAYFVLTRAEAVKLDFARKHAFSRVPMMGFEPIPRFRENGF